jgi:hypothetical protein
MVVLFVGCGCVAETRKNVLFLRRKTFGGIVFVPARMQIGVKLLTKIRFSQNFPTCLVEDSIKIGDKINYWLGIHVWGDESTKRSSTVVKILSAQEI